MPTALRRSEPVTIEAFDGFVAAQADATLFELVEGVIVMMTNPTEVHEQITANIGAPLKLAMDPRGCRTYQGGIRVQRSDDSRDTDKPRPDIVDRGPKLDFYKSLPTVRHIAFIYQDQTRVEHYRRGEQGFELEVLTRPEDVVRSEAVEFRIDLARIYFDVTV